MDEKTLKKMEEQEKYSALHSMHRVEDYRDTWRVFRIMAELVEGYNFLSMLENEITIMGSARFKEGDRNYDVARELGKLLGKNGFTVITGGGPGIMEAANRGAFEAEGNSVGLNIQLPFEQRINPYVKKSTAFHYFFTRKVMLTSPANAFVFCPGGYGTLDEFFEVVDNMELGMMTDAPIVLVNKDFWQPVLDFLRDKGCGLGSLREDQIEKWHLVDTAEEAFEILKNVEDRKQVVCDLSPNNFYCEGNIDWKIFKVMAELVEGFEFITGLEHGVTVLGTKGIGPDSDYYKAAHYIGRLLSERDFTVVTGGKFGIAEAANKGAFESGGKSIGIGMKVGKSREVNAYMNRSILFSFPFTRKLVITAPTEAFVFFPGGFGTMHQLFEILTLVQTKKMEPLPIILYDKKFWEPLQNFIKEQLTKEFKTISEGDENLFYVVDSEEEIIELVEKNHK